MYNTASTSICYSLYILYIREIRDFVKSLMNSCNDFFGELGFRLELVTNNHKPNFYFSHFTNSLVISRNLWFHEFTVTYTQCAWRSLRRKLNFKLRFNCLNEWVNEWTNPTTPHDTDTTTCCGVRRILQSGVQILPPFLNRRWATIQTNFGPLLWLKKINTSLQYKMHRQLRSIKTLTEKKINKFICL